MGRKVEENHKVVEQINQGTAEDLIKQQNAAEDFVLGESEEETQKEGIGQKEEQPESDTDSDIVEQKELLQELLENSVETRENSKELVRLEGGQQKEAFEGTVILTGAATYLDSGIRYFKNKPVKVVEQRVYEQLLKTGLFVHL